MSHTAHTDRGVTRNGMKVVTHLYARPVGSRVRSQPRDHRCSSQVRH
jgi:hypothetical protein